MSGGRIDKDFAKKLFSIPVSDEIINVEIDASSSGSVSSLSSDFTLKLKPLPKKLPEETFDVKGTPRSDATSTTTSSPRRGFVRPGKGLSGSSNKMLDKFDPTFIILRQGTFEDTTSPSKDDTSVLKDDVSIV